MWTKKGLTTSYLGVTIHFISKDGILERAVLDLILFPSPHTGEAIANFVNQVLLEWNISKSISVAVTDNGSSMIKAFKDAQFSIQPEPEETEDCAETETCQQSSVEVIQIIPSPETSDATFDQTQSNRSSIPQTQSESQIESEQPETEPPIPEDPTEMDLQDEEDLYLREEQELTELIDGLLTAPLSKRKIKRISCLSHSLQLVINSFDKFRNRRNGRPRFNQIIGKARQLVAKFNSSTKATPMLIAATKKKLIGDVVTRWSSTYLMLKRLIELRQAVSEICDKLVWDCLTNSEWCMIVSVVNLLEPFACYTQLVSSSKVVTFSSYYPAVSELRLSLKTVKLKSFLLRNFVY